MKIQKVEDLRVPAFIFVQELNVWQAPAFTICTGTQVSNTFFEGHPGMKI